MTLRQLECAWFGEVWCSVERMPPIVAAAAGGAAGCDSDWHHGGSHYNKLHGVDSRRGHQGECHAFDPLTSMACFDPSDTSSSSDGPVHVQDNNIPGAPASRRATSAKALSLAK